MSDLKLPDKLYVLKTFPDGREYTCCTMRQNVFHCIGLIDSGSQRHKPYHRHGKLFYRPWRNYFSNSAQSKDWEELCENGYAAHGPVNDNGVCYWMTRKGLDWLGEQLGMMIQDEED